MTSLNSGCTVQTPENGPVAMIGRAAGGLSAGVYSYKVTFVTAFGETVASDFSDEIALMTTAGSMNLSDIKVSPNEQVIKRRLYRTLSGGDIYYALDYINDNITTEYIDVIADDVITSGDQAPDASTADSRQLVRGLCIFALPIVQTIMVDLEPGLLSQQGAMPLTGYVNIIGSAIDGVKLPRASAENVGMVLVVINKLVGDLDVFPMFGNTIDELGVNDPFVLATGTSKNFVCINSTTWYTY